MDLGRLSFEPLHHAETYSHMQLPATYLRPVLGDTVSAKQGESSPVIIALTSIRMSFILLATQHLHEDIMCRPMMGTCCPGGPTTLQSFLQKMVAGVRHRGQASGRLPGSLCCKRLSAHALWSSMLPLWPAALSAALHVSSKATGIMNWISTTP